jgi:hypothetical protein
LPYLLYWRLDRVCFSLKEVPCTAAPSHVFCCHFLPVDTSITFLIITRLKVYLFPPSSFTFMHNSNRLIFSIHRTSSIHNSTVPYILLLSFITYRSFPSSFLAVQKIHPFPPSSFTFMYNTKPSDIFTFLIFSRLKRFIYFLRPASLLTHNSLTVQYLHLPHL